MKQTKGYALHYIQDIPYLLPYGQTVAEHRRGMKLNESGVFLWHALEQPITRDELLDAFALEYEAMPDELPMLAQDMDQFLHELFVWGMVDEVANDISAPEYPAINLNIAGIPICLHAPAAILSDAFTPYYSLPPSGEADLTIWVTIPNAPSTTSTGGTLIVYTDELVVSRHEKYDCLLFPQAKQIQEVRLQRDGKRAYIYCHLPYRDCLTEDLFHVIRLLFLYRAQKKNFFAVHSASIFYQGKAWLFSGSSGTGKSTHTNLWAKEFSTPIINGDINLITVENGHPVVYGTPWCGTSGIADSGRYPLGGIILLSQAQENHCISLPADEQVLGIMQRMISPAWTKDMVACNIRFAECIAQNILVTRLCCTKQAEAATYMKSEIDTYLRRKL